MSFGPLSRRGALSGAASLAGAVSLVGVPTARAQTELKLPDLRPVDPRLDPSKADTSSGHAVSMTMPGNVKYRAKLFLPAKTPAPGAIIVHDGWGMTPEFESMGATLAFEGMIGLVVDLADGKIAGTQAEADSMAKQIETQQPGDTVSAWYDWLRNRLEGNQRATAFGFGPGGKWAVDGSLHKAAHGVAIWCVRIETPSRELGSIYETFVGHFSDKGAVPGAVLVADIVQRLRATNREGHFFRYGSGVNFYNPRSPDYDKSDAALAWRRTIAVYRKLWNLPQVQ
jgi:carboxymethylenebutenolidase